MLKIYACIFEQHDWRLVIAAVIVCAVSSLACIDIYRRAYESVRAARLRWVCFGAVASGFGVWSTHFVAMLAYEYRFERGLDGFLTTFSGAIGVVLTGAAFAYAIYVRRSHAAFVAGPMLGGAIGAMHYTGMSAYGKAALLDWDYAYVGASFIVGGALATLMFRIFLNMRTEGRKLAAAGVLTLAICALHFIGMSALTIVPLSGLENDAALLSREALALGVIGATMAIMLVNLAAASADHQRLAAQKAEESERLRTIAAELREARDKAEAATRAKADFLANMSHEIRTPMNGVLGIAEALMHSGLDDRQKELASIIVSSGHGLMRVINDILDFSKLEAGKLNLDPEAFNLRQMIGELGAMMQARAVEKDVELIIRYAPDTPEGVVGDENRLRQVVCNIVGNAVKFTTRGHVFINVEGERSGGGADIRIEVTDTGIGISPEQIPKMFLKFEQADTSKSRNYEGAGLGLSICKELMELMGGEIGAASALGEGSTFWITLRMPVADSVRALPTNARDLFENVKVLAVDDNAVNRRLLEELTTGWGMRAEIVGSAAEAMSALERSDQAGDLFDLVLTDYQMPDTDGDAFAARAQGDPRYAGVPFIMLSSLDVGRGRSIATRAVYAAWLAKPIKASRLMDAIAGALNDVAAIRLMRANMLFRDDAPAPPAAPIAAPAQVRAPPSAARIKVLLAEDNVVNQLVAMKMIDADRYDVVVAGDGAAVVEAFSKIRPALVIMDVSMPILNGFEASQKIREIETERGFARTPIIAATAHVLDEDRARCLEAGMDDFIAKPMRKAVLDAILEKWLHAEQRADLRASA